MVRKLLSAVLVFSALNIVSAQATRGSVDLTHPQTYTLHRIGSTDPTGGNHDSIRVLPGATATLMDVDGPGQISHLWVTISDREKYFLKRVVLRMYWDNEASPSVEVPIGDFFGQNTGEYVGYESAVLSIGSSRALNSFFPMPFRRHARITIENQGKLPIDSFYYNLEYRTGPNVADKDSLYFHAQYRQAVPNKGWTTDFYDNTDYRVNFKPNLDAKDNYTFLEATGKGHYVGLTLGVVQNQDGWWGEGDEMLFVDDMSKPAITGTGSEDYILGAWDFGTHFSYQSYGAPLVGSELAGSHSLVYRFHLDSPVPFTKEFKGTIEHGHANHRSDNYYSVAYWYQNEPHAPFSEAAAGGDASSCDLPNRRSGQRPATEHCSAGGTAAHPAARNHLAYGESANADPAAVAKHEDCKKTDRIQTGTTRPPKYVVKSASEIQRCLR